MDTDTFTVKTGEHIPGEVIHKYLEAYTKKFDIADSIRFNTKVLSAEHQDTEGGGWILAVGSTNNKVFTQKLIIATGLTSEPFLPHFEGQESFGGPIFHSKHFRQHRDTLQTAKSATVFGATKFGWDAAYAYATAGVQVHWVIRGKNLRKAFLNISLTANHSFWTRAVLDRPSTRHASQEMDRETRK